MRRPGLPLLAATASLLAACGGSPGGGGGPADCGTTSGTQVRFDPALGKLATKAATWLAAPWPADFRKTARGTLRLVDFPGSTGTLDDYAGVGQGELHGYSTNGAVYFQFTGPLDPASFPTGPAAGLAKGAAIELVNVTAGSPGYGTRRPLRIGWRAKGDQFLPANTLEVAPAFGFPLRPKTTYAVIVTTSVEDAAGKAITRPPRLAWLLGGDARCQARFPAAAADPTVFEDFAPLRARLAKAHVDPATIAAATVFTTEDTLGQMKAIHDQIAAAPAPAYDPAGWQPIGPNGGYSRAMSFQWNSTDTVHYHVMEGRYDAPNYMEGTVPYSSQGGAFHFVGGKPVPVRTEHLRFVLTIPDAPPADGGPCYPIVEYAHGTGGSAYTFVDSDTGARLAARGLAAIGIDQPLHGLRADGKSFNVELATFNVAHMDTARTVMRQGAVDTFSLTRFVRHSLRVPADRSPTGHAICFDPDRVLFFGHSQGGITGSMAAAFETHIHTWMLSGTGGGIAMTVMLRKRPVNFEDLVGLLAGLKQTDQPLDTLHPVVTLIQTLIDVSDPLNYAPYWDRFGTPPMGQSVLMTSGLADQDTPYLTADAEAVAARIPLVATAGGSIARDIPAYDVLGMMPVDPPVSGNLATGATGGFVQWPAPADHFVVFDDPEAINASMRFLQSAAYGTGPIIERDPNADVR